MNIVKHWVEKIAAGSELVSELLLETARWKEVADSAAARAGRAQKHWDECLKRLEQAEGEALRRRRDWRRPEEAMDAEQLAAAFDVPADLALWQAVHQELDAEIMGAVDDATAPGCADRDFRSGGVDALRGFQRRLIDARAKAQVAKMKVASSEE